MPQVRLQLCPDGHTSWWLQHSGRGPGGAAQHKVSRQPEAGRWRQQAAGRGQRLEVGAAECWRECARQRQWRETGETGRFQKAEASIRPQPVLEFTLRGNRIGSGNVCEMLGKARITFCVERARCK